MTSSARRFLETVRRLRPSQVAHRLVRRARGAPSASPLAGPLPARAPLPVEARRPSCAPFDRREGEGFVLAGARVQAEGGGLLPADPRAYPTRLARFHAHYLDLVRGLAEAGDGDGATRLLNGWREGIARTDADALHPYVRARRILALLEAHAHGVVGAEAIVRADAAVLSRDLERDVRGNHLLANAAALLRAGLAARGRRARATARLGATTLSSCVRDQVLADGWHYERSPTYGALVLEHLLGALEACAAAGEAPPAGVEDAARRLAGALRDAVLADGEPVRWRDGAPGLAPPLAPLLLWAARRAGPLPTPRTASRRFDAAGLHVLAAPDGRAEAAFLAAPPCPPDLPAHGHADALAYECVLDGVRVVAAAGTTTYEPGATRDAERRPGAFAGTTVDGKACADPYGAFRLGARGGVRNVLAGDEPWGAHAHATADGFRAQGVRVVHRRSVAVAARGTIAIVDEFAGSGEHDVVRFLPLGAGLAARVVDGGAVVELRGRAAVRLLAPGARVSVAAGTYARGVGDAIPREVLVLTQRLALPARVVHAWSASAADARVEVAPIASREIRVRVVRGDDVVALHVPAGASR